MKKTTFITIFLSFITLVAFAQSTTLSGSGTAADPYLIQGLDDLKFLRDQTNLNEANNYQGNDKYFRLTSDINLENENWTPIGVGSGLFNSFRGYFDGDGHTISNLRIGSQADSANILNAGLFGVTRIAEIKNIRIQNAVVYQAANPNQTDHLNGGILIANADTTTVDNSHVSGSLYAFNHSTVIKGFYIGGMVGYCRNINIYNSSADVEVIGNATIGDSGRPANAGGLVGLVQPNATIGTNIKNCITKGFVHSTSSASANGTFIIVGGVVGNFQGPNATGVSSTLENCITTTKIKITSTATSNAGLTIAIAGLLGSNGTGNNISDCIANNDSIIIDRGSTIQGGKKFYNRIMGNGSTIRSNNYANESMVVLDNGTNVIFSKGLTTDDGEDLGSNVPATLLNTYCSYYSAPSGFSWNGWVVVNISSTDDQKGTVQGGGLCFNNVSSTIIATPKAGYKFSVWKENGAVVSTDAVYSFVPGNTDRNLFAEFVTDLSNTVNIFESRFVELKGSKLHMKSQNVYLSIIDIAGKLIFTGKPQSDFVFEKPGVYLVKARIGGVVECYKIMINN